MDLSSEDVASNWPSAEISALCTGAVGALSFDDFPLLPGISNRTVLSCGADAIKFLRGENCMPVTTSL